jgi:flavin reductase (DIM6/NTAB) family NADH-FMN oxidoreductase RutF
VAVPITPIEIHRALAHANGCAYIVTSRFDGRRAGMLATSAQLCGIDPPLVCIAAPKGHRVDLLMRDSQCFALCCVPPSDRLLLRRFAAIHTPDSFLDPFDGLELDPLVSGAPILKRSIAALDCQMFRHFDLESDHELLIGRVLAVRMHPHGA